MTLPRNRFGLRVALTGALIALLPLTVAAQLEEVVVTANKRATSLQDVPLAVSVVDAQIVQRSEIRDLLDLQSVVPSLRVPQFQNSVQTNFVIRGFGNGANNPGIEPSVAVFIDGVYRSRSLSRISDLPNIEQIEVLRGPQSTLYGKNASAGVILVNTAKPQFETTGHIEGGVGNYNQRSVRGYVTGPLTDSIAASFGGSSLQRDGYFDNVALGTELNDRDRWALRGELMFDISESTELRVAVDFDELEEACCGTTNLFDGPAGGALAALSIVPGTAYSTEPYEYETYLNQDPVTKAENGGITVDFSTEIGDLTFRSITGYRESKVDNENEDIDYSAADAIGNQRYLTDIDTFTQEFRLSGTNGAMDWLVGAFYYDESIYFESDIDFGTQWRNYANILVGGSPAAGEAVIGGLEALLGYPTGTFFEPGTGVLEVATMDNETMSVFGQASFDLTSRTQLTLGFNYLDDEKDVGISQINDDAFSKLALDGADGATALTNAGFLGAFPSAFAATFGLPFTPDNAALVGSTPAGAAGLQQLQAAVFGQVAAAVAMADLSDPTQNPFVGLQALQFLPQMLELPNAADDGTSADEKFTYTASISHDFSDQLNVYLTYATGYKATSWNLSRDTRPTQGEYDALVSAGVALPNNLTIGTRLAGPEESEVLELGIKYSAPWGYVNAALFNQTIEGFQSNVFTGAGFNLANAGEQSVDGVEVDVMLRPTERLSLGVSGTYLDPFYDAFIGANVGGAAEDLSGTKPGGIPELTLSLIGSYDFTILGWDAWIQADYRYDKEVDIQDGGDQSASNILLETTGSRTREVGLLNASVGIARNGWEFRVWGRNLTNDEYLITWFPSVAQTGSFSGYPNQPRMWGASIRKSF